MTYQLYIGANNLTHKVELAKIKRIIGKRHQGFTIIPSIGYWLGTEEKSIAVVISDDDATVLETIDILKQELEQEAIGYQVAPELRFA